MGPLGSGRGRGVGWGPGGAGGGGGGGGEYGGGAGLVDGSVAVAMIGAGMLSVLLFPLIGLKWARMDARAVCAEAI